MVEGHSTDDTLGILMDWLRTKQDWMLFKHNISETYNPRQRMFLSSNLYHQVFIRDHPGYQSCTYIFKCDCDIEYIPPETLGTLIELDVDIVAPYTYISTEDTPDNPWRHRKQFYDTWGYRHLYGPHPGYQRQPQIHEYYSRNLTRDKTIQADTVKRLLPMQSVGANPVLVKRKVLKKVEYDGRNAMPGFIRRAVAEGFKAWAYPDIECIHTWKSIK